MSEPARHDGALPAIAERYYIALAAAYVRGSLELPSGIGDDDALRRGLDASLRLHRFKRRDRQLPRVQHVLGILRGIWPASVTDIGSGRGTFLWPLLDALPHLEVTAVDIDPRRVDDIEAVRKGGITRLRAMRGDVERLNLPDGSADIVTVLEVLEHLDAPDRAASEAMRVARRCVIASVPSHADDNPQHIRLFDRAGLERLFLNAGARTVRIEYVPNHMIATAWVGDAG